MYDNEGIPDNIKINSESYNLDEFNRIKYDKRNSFATLHINIESINYHIDDLKQFIALTDTKWDIIAITESRIRENREVSRNIFIPNFHKPLSTPTTANKGGVLLYISEDISFKPRGDLKVVNPTKFETVFAEVIRPNEANIIIGCIYRHHNISIKEFNETCMTNILEKLSHEKNKCSILLGDFNTNLIEYGKNEEISNFLNNMLSNNFLPQVLQPTRITNKSSTLIDNIYISNSNKVTLSGNITVKIADHFSQFLILQDTPKYIKYKNLTKRDFRNFNEVNF